MAQKLDYFQIRQIVNPFGILFHPPAIERLVDFAQNQREFVQADAFCHNERWHHFDAHSDMSHASPQEFLDRLNSSVSNTRQALQDATHILITYGTAWIYREIETARIVANCHKLPQQEFTKELLQVPALTESIENTIAMIHHLNPSAQLIFTISPVRHVKDGFTGNQRSKAHLIAALHQVLGSANDTCLSYFPSYEILMDELRDYRFYASDLLHPNQLGIDYIWEKFTDCWIADDAKPVMVAVDAVRKRLAHRAFDPDSNLQQTFAQRTQQAILTLQQQHPHMVF